MALLLMIHDRSFSEYGALYFHGLLSREKLISGFLIGADGVMAGRPEEVIVSGLEDEKRGRMMDCKR